MNKSSSIRSHYEYQWQNRLERASDEEFSLYERNWRLPELFKNNEKVLDLASGNSIVGEFLQKNYSCKVVAFDISPSAIKAASSRGVKGVVGSVEKKLPFKSSTFDTVFWGDNIEHVFYPENVLKEIHRVLKKSGRLILSTPNQAYWRYRIFMFVNGALPKTEGEDNKPWEWTHIRFFNRKILTELLNKVGFAETRFIGISRRRLDRPFLNILPEIFGMIMISESRKT